VSLDGVVGWLLGRGLALVVGGAAILLLYRVAIATVHRVVPSVLRAQATHLPAGSSSGAEIDKRIATIENLLVRLLRFATVALLGTLALALFDLWPVLAVIVVVVVAILFTSSDVILDYVMGFLILVEGPYFEGDWVTVGGVGGAEGAVEEIGLRRTVLRDAMGSVHAVSNGMIRQSSNVTRVFSIATVELQLPRAGELDRAIQTMMRVAGELRGDVAWSDRFLADATTDISVTAIGIDGPSVRIQQRVIAGAHGPVASELRTRLVSAFASASIGTGRWDTPLPITTEARGVGAA
jgi:small conductance mechanosensitive channel